ncbi:putative nuclease HARBI1 [Lineus longissimus]|uniref:putative nuclease HARBI1 n=1 Tax=Lineus longissimus TaxID=88925 RepID=UPI00315CD1F6
MAVAFLLADQENRRARRRERIFRDRMQPLDYYDDVDLMKRYRMPRHVLTEVIDLIRADVEHPTQRSHAIPATLQILTAIRFFATGSFQLATADMCGSISQPSTSRIVTRVATALQRISPNIIAFPRERERRNLIKEGFYNERRRIPSVLGCLDGSLVQIKRPSQDEAAYVCRHNYHAINVQGVCSHDKKFTNIMAQWPGSTHDSFMWTHSHLNRELANDPHRDGHLLGDSAYPLRPWVLTPIQNPADDAERQYKIHHRRIRQAIEGTFGRWKVRWQCLHAEGGILKLRPERCCRVIIATAVLHNICEEHGIPLPPGVQPMIGNNPDLDDNRPVMADDADGTVARARIIREHFWN